MQIQKKIALGIFISSIPIALNAQSRFIASQIAEYFMESWLAKSDRDFLDINSQAKKPFQIVLNHFLPTNQHYVVNRPASVMNNDDALNIELEATYNRFQVTDEAQKKVFGPEGNYLISGIAASGGGYRAMIATFGFLKGLQSVGLLDTTLYIAGLSGSTWAMGSWLSLGGNLDDVMHYVGGHLNKKILSLMLKATHLPITSMATKWVYSQPISFIDRYGAAVFGNLLTPQKGDTVSLLSSGVDPLDIRMTDQCALIESGKVPFPIYTAVVIKSGTIENEWLNGTPYTFGFPAFNAHVHTWAFNREFKKGISRPHNDGVPEQPLSFLLGMFGSAHTATVHQALESFFDHGTDPAINPCWLDSPQESDSLLKKFAYKIIKSTENDRLVDIISEGMPMLRPLLGKAEVNNFLFKSDIALPENNQRLLTLSDAAHAYNIPVLPLLERNIEVLYICDASENVTYPAEDLFKAALDARKRNRPFPALDPIDIIDRINKGETMLVFPSNIMESTHKPNTPVVFYFPFAKNIEYSQTLSPLDCTYCDTLNFKYTRQEFNELSGLYAFNVVRNAPIIQQVLTYVSHLPYGE